MTTYLDASVVVSLFVADIHSEAADRLIANLHEDVIVSELCALEFAGSVSRGVRTGRLSEQAAMEALADFDEWRALSTVASPTKDQGPTGKDRCPASPLIKRDLFGAIANPSPNSDLPTPFSEELLMRLLRGFDQFDVLL